MSTTLPTGSSYGSQVLTSGDLSVRSISARNKYTVYRPDPLKSDAKTSHLAYIADTADDSVTECARVITEASGGVGLFSVGVLQPGAGTVEKSFNTETKSTKISTGGVSATFEQSGLSFDSDDCAVFFGKDKTFRIMFTDNAPARLVFQCLNKVKGEYVTKFSCAKE